MDLTHAVAMQLLVSYDVSHPYLWTKPQFMSHCYSLICSKPQSSSHFLRTDHFHTDLVCDYTLTASGHSALIGIALDGRGLYGQVSAWGGQSQQYIVHQTFPPDLVRRAQLLLPTKTFILMLHEV